jgi:arylsulfatase A-like enzyme
MKDYLRCIKAVDDSVAKLTEFLDQNGLAQNTVVIYSSDQGFYNGEHGWFDKRWIYEESLHMPLIVRWPGVVKPGTRIDAFAQNVDYAPTFAEIAGAKTPPNLHGRSLVPLLKGNPPPADWRDRVYYHFYDDSEHAVPKHFGMRTDRFTIARFYTLDEWELYDLEKDPQQMHSVANDPAYAAKFSDLKRELEQLKNGFGDRSDQPKKP